MMRAGKYDDEAALLDGSIPSGVRVGVIGSTTLWHEESKQICPAIGTALASFNDLILLTGGVPGAGELVGRSFWRVTRELGRTPTVIHILPRDSMTWDYGTTLFAGDDMSERREILARLAKAFLVVEGGPGTEHEARVAAAHGAALIPVARLGGHARALYQTLLRPPFADSTAWEMLANPEVTADRVSAAVVNIIDSYIRTTT